MRAPHAWIAALVLPVALQVATRPLVAQAPATNPAQGTRPPTTVGAARSLDDYVALGLRQNPELRRQRLGVERSDAVVREARGYFLPSATLNARHTTVQGRGLDLGTLFNPAFAALNQLLGAQQFPTDIDLRLPLKQETSVRLAQPIFQPAILYGYRAARAAREAQASTVDAASRDLAASIRRTYIEHLKARRLSELRLATRLLIEEQVRVVSRLVEAGRATPDALSRVRAEHSESVQREAESAQLVEATAQGFNMMLARELTDSIATGADTALGFGALPSLGESITNGLAAREELQATDAGRRAALAQRRAAQTAFLPNVSVAVDYGIQGNEYRFTRDADFTAVSVVASWNLFNGGRDAARVQQAGIDARGFALQEDDARRGVELQVRLAWQAAAVAQAAIATAGDQRSAAARTHELVRRRWEEGLASPLELSEARTALTTAELNAVFTNYDYYLRRVELDRAAAFYPRTAK